MTKKKKGRALRKPSLFRADLDAVSEGEIATPPRATKLFDAA
jgi:hypothetical protein